MKVNVQVITKPILALAAPLRSYLRLTQVLSSRVSASRRGDSILLTRYPAALLVEQARLIRSFEAEHTTLWLPEQMLKKDGVWTPVVEDPGDALRGLCDKCIGYTPQHLDGDDFCYANGVVAFGGAEVRI